MFYYGRNSGQQKTLLEVGVVVTHYIWVASTKTTNQQSSSLDKMIFSGAVFRVIHFRIVATKYVESSKTEYCLGHLKLAYYALSLCTLLPVKGSSDY